jgi:hypothetical protein
MDRVITMNDGRIIKKKGTVDGVVYTVERS